MARLEDRSASVVMTDPFGVFLNASLPLQVPRRSSNSFPGIWRQSHGTADNIRAHAGLTLLENFQPYPRVYTGLRKHTQSSVPYANLSAMFFFKNSHKNVILRACDYFDLSCFLHIPPAVFQTPDKGVILSEALRRSIANEGLYSAESKDPGDACWQMLLRAFRPRTTTEDKKVTNSDRSAEAVRLSG
jgi:hypothetical protein